MNCIDVSIDRDEHTFSLTAQAIIILPLKLRLVSDCASKKKKTQTTPTTTASHSKVNCLDLMTVLSEFSAQTKCLQFEKLHKQIMDIYLFNDVIFDASRQS